MSDHGIPMSRLLCLLTLLLLSLLSTPAAAVEERDLLPVDQAFALRTSAAPGRIELHWTIAPGYYLYRHRTEVSVEAGDFAAQPLQLPAGEKHQDEFFGEVETYRQALTAVLPGAGGSGPVALKVKFQGCADIGICYPPQTRRIEVALPASSPLGLPPAPERAPLVAGTGSQAELPAERAFQFDAIALDGNRLLLRFTPAPGYYLYRDKTRLTLLGAPGVALQAAQWPPGTAHRDGYFGDVVVYFDQVEVPVPLARTVAQAVDATLQVEFQGCRTGGICYPPMRREVRLGIPAGEVAPAQPPATGGANVAGAAGSATGDVPRTRPPAQLLAGGQPAAASFGAALLLALLGGLVLNLMPCVLPVLSLKALSVAESGRQDARRRALWYTAGVMLSFLAVGALVVGLRAAGQALGWGFQLQQPWVVALLAYVMFAVGLNLSGVFALGHRLAGVGYQLSGRSGAAGDFSTGVLAVVVASPCTAPFMATALAYAFAAPVALALLVFLALGLGLALPFLLLGFVPGLSRRLPRPGPWMHTFKQVLAFPMYLTAVWLLWVLGQQRGVDALGLVLAGLVVLALGLWWYQRQRLRPGRVAPVLAVALVLVALLPLGLVQRLAPASARAAAAPGQVAYSEAALAQLRAQKRIVFVDMTADWCVTCKANEKAVLSTARFRAALARHDAVLMTGDWTAVDPAITAFLDAHRAVGVPLYVVFPRSGGPGEVLPTVLTAQRVEAALARAAR